jgi:ribonuclease HI
MCLNDQAPKYDPLAIEPHDTLSLTPNRKARNTTAQVLNQGIIFNPTITCKDGITECFRVFTNPGRISLTPACRQLQQGIDLNHLEMRAYTNGSCMNNRKYNETCGSGAWLGENHPMNMAIKIPGNKQSNKIGEIVAVIAAVETLPNYCKLTIVTNSRYVIDGLTKHLTKWEDNGWIETKKLGPFQESCILTKAKNGPNNLQVGQRPPRKHREQRE